jgi:Ca-activated chloride channel family protein
MIFRTPLALLALLPLAFILLLGKNRPVQALPFPGVEFLPTLPRTVRQRLAQLLPWLHPMMIFCLILALARPQLVKTETTVTSRGVDIVIALDLSTSMLAVDRGKTDRTLSRFTIARKVVRDFIARRTGDRIGFVAFAARPYPLAPLTLDHDWLAAVLDKLEIGGIEDGTAIGDAIMAAVNRLRFSSAGSRTVVLVTDGRSNVGEVTPRNAAAVARTLGIKVHTIGIGGSSPALFPVDDPFGGVIWREISADLDEAALREIAATTGGRYYHAGDTTALGSVFLDIDRMERRPIEEKRRQSFKELSPLLILSSLFLYALFHTLRSTWLRGS